MEAINQTFSGGPGYRYSMLRHVTDLFLLPSLRDRVLDSYDSRRGGPIKLRIDRSRVVDSTVECLSRLADADIVDAMIGCDDRSNLKIVFSGQRGCDAGGLTADWLSLFMLDVMDPFRQPPLFLLPQQTDGMKEASCLRLNHSLQAFGITKERQAALMRTIGFVLAVCLKLDRYASNKYMLSKSLLQRLLGQELPPGLLCLSEEFPEEYQASLLSCNWQMFFFLLQPSCLILSRIETRRRAHASGAFGCLGNAVHSRQPNI